MWQFVPCNGCSNQVPTPEILEGKPIPQFLRCEACGKEFFWNGGLADNSGPLILFSIEDSVDSLETADDLATEQKQKPNGFDPEENSLEDDKENNDPEIAEEIALALETQPIDAVQAPFELELEIESESNDPSDSVSPHLPAADVAIEHEGSAVPSEPFYEVDQRAPSNSIEPTFVADAVVLAEAPVPLETSPAVDWSVLGPAVPRRRPKEVSAIRKIVPPVLGGLAAFPIATLILWYGFGRDIGTTGPTVAKYVPWIVPEKFRSMPLEISTPKIAGGRPQRSTPSTRNSLPSLNRDETTGPATDRFDATAPIVATQKPNVAPEKTNPPAQPKTTSINESSIAKIQETIDALKTLQKEMENAPPDKKFKAKIFIDCQAKLKELSKQASELIGPSSRIWRQQLESISQKILSDSVIPKAMKLLANNAREEIPASAAGDFVATVIDVGDANTPSSNEAWYLREKWVSDKVEIPIEVLSGAWRSGSATLPATCLVFGRLVPREDSDAYASNRVPPNSNLVLKVHLLVPK